jgi:hypothetical protein
MWFDRPVGDGNPRAFSSPANEEMSLGPRPSASRSISQGNPTWREAASGKMEQDAGFTTDDLIARRRKALLLIDTRLPPKVRVALERTHRARGHRWHACQVAESLSAQPLTKE